MSDDDFLQELLCGVDEAKANHVYYCVATAIKHAVSVGNIEDVKKFKTYLAPIYDVKDKKDLDNCYIDHTSLITLSCKHNQIEMLQYLFSLNGTSEEHVFYPGQLDKGRLNAFYYAVRSNDVQLLDALMGGASDAECLRVLAEAFEELKLKNMPLSEEMQLNVVRKLVTNTLLSERCETENYQIDTRKKLIIDNIRVLRSEYGNKVVDGRFLHLAKVVVHHVHILRQILNWDAPWEHLDLCLVRFISSFVKLQERNIIYRYVLTKQKILRYLLVFLNVLVKDEYQNIGESDVMKELSADYWQIQEVDSLDKMRYYAETLEKESGEEETERAMGELRRYLRPGALTPPLRSLLCLSAPPYLFCTDRPCITQIQENFKMFASLLTHVLFRKNMTIFIAFLKKIIAGECLEMQRVFHAVQCEGLLSDAKNDQGIEQLFQQLNSTMTVTKLLERKSIELINRMMNISKKKLDNLPANYCMAIKAVLNYRTQRHAFHSYILKYSAKKILDDITLSEEPPSVTRIFLISRIMIQTASMLRINIGNEFIDEITYFKMKDVFFKISFIVSYETGDNRYMETFRNLFHINECCLDSFELKHLDELLNPVCGNSEIKNLKKSRLRNILKENDFSKNVILTRNNKLPAVEFLVLDILSRLCELDGLFLLDLPCSLVRGEVLRRYLLLSSPVLELSAVASTIALIAIAYQVAQENVVYDCRHPLYVINLEDKHYKDLFIINNQQRMFTAVEKGNLNELENCVSAGADLEARDFHMSTVLHYVAKGESYPMLKFILGENVNLHIKNDRGESPLHIATAHGQINSLEYLLLAGMPVDAVDNNQRTPLHLAALYGHTQLVNILLKYNARPSAADILKLTPLHYSVKNHHPDIVKILLKHETNADTTEGLGGYTLLMMAAEHGYRDLTELFLQRGSDIDHRNDRGKTPLHVAAHNGHEKVVHYLLSHGAMLNARAQDNCTPLHYAMQSEHDGVVQILLEHKADVNTIEYSSWNTPLHIAVTNGQCNLVDLLLQHGAQVEAQTLAGVTPLHLACRLGHLEIVQSLISHKATIFLCDTNGRSALHYASRAGQAHIVQYLVDMGASVDVTDYCKYTPLHLAAQNGKNDASEILIAKGATVDAKDDEDFTPLHFSALNSHTEVVEVLLKNGAHIDTKNKHTGTPLHLAIETGNLETVECLLQAGANINIADGTDCQPIHLATIGGYVKILQTLINAGAEVNSSSSTGSTPLHVAAGVGDKAILKMLLKEGARVDSTTVEGLNALCAAVQNDHRDVARILIENGSDVNAADGWSLVSACSTNSTSIVNMLLDQKEIKVNVANVDGCTPLHLAAKYGNLRIVQRLLERGAYVDVSNDDRLTPLHLASLDGHVDIVKILLDRGARLGCVGHRGLSSLHLAASNGHANVVSLLLARGAHNYRTAAKNTPLGIAAGFGHVGVVKAMIQSYPSLVNSVENASGTVLHIAAQEGHLEMCKYLIHVGFQIKCSNDVGSKPIHVAAREGHLQVVEYLLNHGCGVNDRGIVGQIPLHYAALGGSVPVATFLLNVGSNINALDQNRMTPLHIAAACGHTDLVKYLLSRGAAYDMFDRLHRKPCNIAKNKNLRTVLFATEMLFTAMERNKHDEVKDYLEAGAPIEARNRAGMGPLHIACQQGYLFAVRVLLEHGANADAVDPAGNTPLHLACLRSHTNIAKTLLIYGAKFNPSNVKNQTPSHFGEKGYINDLLKKLHQAFRNVKNGQIKVIDFLNNINDIDTLKAIMNSRNPEGKTLIIVAIRNNFPMTDKLKQILQHNLTHDMELVKALQEEGKYKEALNMLQRLLRHSQETLGTKCPSTWEIQQNIADILYRDANYSEALSLYREVHQKQIETLGPDNEDSLDTWAKVAITLYGLCEYEEALNIFRSIYEKQTVLLGANHNSTRSILCHIGLTLDKLQRFQEALDAYRKVLSTEHPSNLLIRSNVAMICLKQGKYQESLDKFQEVYEASSVILGPDHPDTLKTLYNRATVLLRQIKLDEALAALNEVCTKQEKALGPYHADTLVTQSDIGDIYFTKCNWITALKYYNEGFEKRKSILGAECPDILETQNKLKIIKIRLDLQGKINLNDMVSLENNIHNAVSAGNKKVVEDLLECGTNPNIRDNVGRTPLHYAVFGGHLELVAYLLDRGADVNIRTNKGNTPLHTAAFKGNAQIVESLIEHVKQKQSSKQMFFINARTGSTGSTALHIAAKGGFLSIVESLLNFGAVYNVTNKDEQTPLDLSTNEDVSKLLCTVDQLFNDAKSGKVDTLNSLKENQVSAVINARNNLDQTPLQVALHNKHRTVATLLAQKLKNIK